MRVLTLTLLFINLAGCSKQLNSIVGSEIPPALVETPNTTLSGHLKISSGQLRTSGTHLGLKATISPTDHPLTSTHLGMKVSISAKTSSQN